MQTSSARLRSITRALDALAVVLVLAVASYSWAVSKAKFDGDEAEWIGTSKYFQPLFVEGDLSDYTWRDNYWTRTQPMMARYVIGGWLWLRGYDLGLLNPYYEHNLSQAANLLRGNGPTDEVLTEARRPMRALAALSIVALYLTVRIVAGPVGGLAAVTLACGSPYLREHLIRAMGDTVLMFFVFAAMLAATLAVTRWANRHDRVGWSLATSLFLGLALGAKLTAVLAWAALAGWAFLTSSVLLLGRRDSLDRRTILQSLAPIGWAGAVLALAFGVFVATDPFLYRDPFGRARTMFENRQYEMASISALEPWRAVSTASERVFQVFDRSLVHETMGSSYLGMPLEAVLAPAGLAGLVVRIVRHRRHGELLVLLWTATFFAGVSWGLGYRLQHYFIPTAMMGTVLGGIAVGFATRWLIAHWPTRAATGTSLPRDARMPDHAARGAEPSPHVVAGGGPRIGLSHPTSPPAPR